MRQGLRASAPARADRATAYRAPPQLWGPDQFKGWLSPYLPMGSGARQNRFGNLHAQTGATSGTAGVGSMAFSSLGDTFTGRRVVINGTISGSTLTVNSVISGSPSDIGAGMAVLYDAWRDTGSSSVAVISSGSGPYTLSGSPPAVTGVQITLIDRYLSIDGQPAFSRVADPQDASKLCWLHRVLFADMRPSGQAWGTGLRKVLARHGDTGLEASNGQGIVQPYGTYYLEAFALKIPAATKAITRYAESNLLWQEKDSTDQPSLALFHWAGRYRGSNDGSGAPQIDLAGPDEPRLVMRLWNGQTNGNYLLAANYPADTWIYFVIRSKPHQTDGSAHLQVWVAVGDAAAAKVCDTTRGHSHSGSADSFRQWGWYVFMDTSYYHTDGTSHGSREAWWGGSDEMRLYVKEPLVALQWRADAEPPLWLVDRWFDQLRAR